MYNKQRRHIVLACGIGVVCYVLGLRRSIVQGTYVQYLKEIKWMLIW